MDVDIVRAWKDPVYRAQLTPEQRAALLEHPAGSYELDDELLSAVAGGAAPIGSEGWLCTVSGECNGGSSCCPWPISW